MNISHRCTPNVLFLIPMPSVCVKCIIKSLTDVKWQSICYDILLKGCDSLTNKEIRSRYKVNDKAKLYDKIVSVKLLVIVSIDFKPCPST